MSERKRTWDRVVDFMRRRTGVSLGPHQSYLLEGRIGPIVARHNYPSIEFFVNKAVEQNAPAKIVELLFDALTTHETSFFRDPPFWKGFGEHVIPHILSCLETKDEIVIWSAGCSTGQEPYSLAILLDDIGEGIASRTRIYASDISLHTIERAKEGYYSSFEINRGMDDEHLVQYFEQDVGFFRVNDYLKSRIHWFQHNLVSVSAPPILCDIVLCRNTLIYFDDSAKAKAMKCLRSALRSGGCLGVGVSEMVSGMRGIVPGWYVNKR